MNQGGDTSRPNQPGFNRTEPISPINGRRSASIHFQIILSHSNAQCHYVCCLLLIVRFVAHVFHRTQIRMEDICPPMKYCPHCSRCLLQPNHFLIGGTSNDHSVVLTMEKTNCQSTLGETHQRCLLSTRCLQMFSTPHPHVAQINLCRG